jgi:hypothetical protein
MPLKAIQQQHFLPQKTILLQGAVREIFQTLMVQRWLGKFADPRGGGGRQVPGMLTLHLQNKSLTDPQIPPNKVEIWMQSHICSLV